MITWWIPKIKVSTIETIKMWLDYYQSYSSNNNKCDEINNKNKWMKANEWILSVIKQIKWWFLIIKISIPSGLELVWEVGCGNKEHVWEQHDVETMSSLFE